MWWFRDRENLSREVILPLARGVINPPEERNEMKGGRSGMPTLPVLLVHLQQQLFPMLEEELGSLSALDQQFSEVLALWALTKKILEA